MAKSNQNTLMWYTNDTALRTFTILLICLTGHFCAEQTAPATYAEVLGQFTVNPEDRIVGAHSEPQGVSVAEPNLGALLGIANPLTGRSAASLLHGFGGQLPAGVGIPPPAGDLKALCQNVNSGGNSDALTNLLVYQYLSNSLPNGAAHLPASNTGAPQVNPQLQALLEGSLESKTATTVTTTITTRTLNMEATTKFFTSTTSYVTTITSIASSVIPIIFRGSKLTTTITDRLTDVLTVTEFFTSSSVLTPSIIQTLPVEVTLTHTSTRGLNGHYTLAHVTTGASKVIEQPINSASIDFDTKGLDLSNFDLSSLDLSTLRGGNKNDVGMVNALTALLSQYGGEDSAPRGRDNNRNENVRAFPQSRFHARNQDHRNQRHREESPPKFNFIKGFTLRDREPARDNNNRNSGTALENTRYSKFRKKNTVENNSLTSSVNDRESERFSASTDRRTVSRSSQRRRSRGSSRANQPTIITGRSVSGGISPRINREVDSRRDRRPPSSGIDLRAHHRQVPPRPNVIRFAPERKFSFKTTVLTMHISGTREHDVSTVVRTVTLRAFSSDDRIKRQIHPSDKQFFESPQNTELPEITNKLRPEEVIHLLKGLDKSKVKEMLQSLRDWVEYYTLKVLDETVENSNFSKKSSNQNIINKIPEILSSKSDEDFKSSQDATKELQSLPNSLTKKPIIQHSSSSSSCPQLPPSTVTETVYKTLYVPKPN